MILECPSCEAKFKIPPGAIPEAGRKVRCANCKNTWHATHSDIFKPQKVSLASAIGENIPASRTENTLEQVDQTPVSPDTATPSVEQAMPPHDSGVEAEDIGGDEAGHDADADIGVEMASSTDPEMSVAAQTTDFIENIKAGLEDIDYEDDFTTIDDDIEEDDFLARRRAEQRKEHAKFSEQRKRKFVTVGWAALVALWVSVIVALAFFKDNVVAVFPAADALYSSVGSIDYTDKFRPAEGETVTPPITEEVTKLEAYIIPPPTIEMVDGQQTLVVKGYVENKSRRAASVPKIELQVVDNRGRVIQNWVHEPKGSIITRGAKLDFETTLSPVPAGVVRAVVKVIEGSKSSVRAEYS
jgi:predicted Zn finger-like uncharacterized protein